MTTKHTIKILLAVLLLMASCGDRRGNSSGSGRSIDKIRVTDRADNGNSSDPDKLMDEIVAAGRAGNDDKVRELRESLYNEKMTVEQARRYIFEIEPKAMLLDYDGGSWNEEAFFCDYLDIDEDCRQVLREITEMQSSHNDY